MACRCSGFAIQFWRLNCSAPPAGPNCSSFPASCLRRGDIGRYVFALDGGAAITSTATLARKAGFIVDETPEGWTAIEPMPGFWDEEPGAHMRWSAEISDFDAGMGPFPALWIVYSEVTNSDGIEDSQDVNGWRVKVAKSRNNLKVTYRHS